MIEFIRDTPNGKVSKPIIYLEIISYKVYNKIKAIKRYKQYKVVGYCKKEY